MKIFSASQMRELDAYTIEQEQITPLELMERAAKALYQEILVHYPDIHERQILVFAGPGGNGGDALVVARHLAKQSAHPSVFLFNTEGKLSDECATNRDRLLAECPSVKFCEVAQQFEVPDVSPQTIIIDGLFGTGLTRPLTGGYAALVKFINTRPAQVISLDMPSGLMAEDNTYNVQAHIVRATLTLTLQVPKLAQILPDMAQFVGHLVCVDINLSQKKLETTETAFSLTEKEELMPLLQTRPTFGHKGTFGHALVIAGKFGQAGAAVLSTRALLRSGAGKATIHTPRSNNDILQTCIPEAILSHDTDTQYFSSAVPSETYQAVAIGPGIGTHQRTALALIDQVRHTQCPIVLDADAINILASHKGWLQQIPKDTILTPHPGELLRLGICNNDSFSLLSEARQIASRYQFYVVLKGHFTAICAPNGHTYFNTTGSHALATAGTGDVLTGVITALLAQGYSQLDACRLGVWLHGTAGDIAARRLTPWCVTASDVINALPEAFLQLQMPLIPQTSTSRQIL